MSRKERKISENSERNAVSETVREVRTEKKKRSKKFLILYAVGFAFLVYASFTIINQGIEISEKKAERDRLKHELEIVEIRNDSLREVKEYSGDALDEYIEKLAREDLDYIKNGERVFINISGD